MSSRTASDGAHAVTAGVTAPRGSRSTRAASWDATVLTQKLFFEDAGQRSEGQGVDVAFLKWCIRLHIQHADARLCPRSGMEDAERH